MPFRRTPTGPKSRPVGPPIVRPKKRRGRGRPERRPGPPAGPYRSESSKPSIRAKATPTERRRASRGKSKSAKRTRRLAKQDRRRARQRAVLKPPSLGQTVKRAQRETRKVARLKARAERAENRALETWRKASSSIPPHPKTATSDARRGVRLTEGERKAFRALHGKKALKRVESAEHEHVRANEGIEADPLAELAISTIATAGLGAGAKGIGTLGKAAVKAAGREAAGEAAIAGRAAKAAKGLKARGKAAAKRRAQRVRETPQRVKTAPARAKRAAKTKEGRRAAARGAARTAARRPVRTGYGAALAVPTGTGPGDVGKRARAFTKGTAAAFTHPGKVGETTVQAGLGLLTFPLAVGGAGLESVKEGSTKPLRDELGQAWYIPPEETGTGRPSGLRGITESLASGDPQRVEETTLQESGAVPFIPVPAIARRVKRSEGYQGARRYARGKVEGRRAKAREKQAAEQQAARERGEYVPRKQRRKQDKRKPVEDTATGEQYISRRVGRKIEKQRSRHRVKREVARMEEESNLAGSKAAEAVAKKLRKSKLADRSEQNIGEAMRPVLKYGLPADEARGIALVEMLDRRWPREEPGAAPIAGAHLDRHSTRYILDHPEVFRDPDFWSAVKEFDRQSAPLATSKRNRYLAQVDGLINSLLEREGRTRILKPEEMIRPETVKLLPDQGRPWSRSDVYEYLLAREDQLKALRREGRAAEAKVIARNQKALVRSMRGLMKPPEYGGPAKGVATTRSLAYTAEMERAFVRAAKREIEHFGLREPAPYVADVIASGLKGGESLPAFGAALPSRKIWPSRGVAAKSGNALSDFETLLHSSLAVPHARAAAVRGLKRIFDSGSRKVGGRRYLTRKEFARQVNLGNVPDGVIPVRTQMLRALLEGERPVDPARFRDMLFEEVEAGQKLVAGEELAGEMALAKELGVKGEKFAPMDGAAISELMGHMEGVNKYVRGFGHATNFATRTILNSPAFEAAQFAQEGIPLAAALGRDLWNVPKGVKALAEISKFPPEVQAQIRAVVGSSVGIIGAPKLRPWRAEGFMDPVRAAGGKASWEHAWELVNGTKLTRFDRARAGRFRETGAVARIEGDFARAEKGFRAWRDSANNLFKDMEKAVEEMRGMTPAERAAYVTSHPKLADRLQREMKGMAGEWNAYTVFEKHIAPFTIFYPFLRYSVLWTMYHFPFDHPVVATGLAALGAVNAAELERVAATKGASPDILDYTKPVVSTGHGEMVLPGGLRFFPALAAPQQAILEGKPGQSLSALSPPIGIALEALVGKNFYTDDSLDENGWLYMLRQGANLSPFLRFLGVPETGKKRSAASKAFRATDPRRTERSVLNPYIGQSGKDFAREKRLGKAFREKYGKGREYRSNLPPEVWDAAFSGDWRAAKRLRRERERAERGAGRVRRAEKPFFEEGGGALSEEGKEILKYITGEIVLPADEGKTGNPYLDALPKKGGGNVYLEALPKKGKGNPYLEALE